MGQVDQVLEGSRRDRGDVGVGDREPAQVKALKTKRGDVLKVWPVIYIQTSQVCQLAKVLVLQGSDAEVAKAKSDQAAKVGQCLARDGCEVTSFYCKILQPQQPRESLGIRQTGWDYLNVFSE